MASSTILNVLPPERSIALPRKSSLKKPKTVHVSNQTPGGLNGVAFQVTSPPGSPPAVQPASDHIKHSLLCEPPTPHGYSTNRVSAKRHLRAKRSCGSSSSESISPQSNSDASTFAEGDQLGPLPENTHFGSPQRRGQSSSHLKRPDLPRSVSTEAQIDYETPPTSDDEDELSPLPNKQRFSVTAPKSPEFPGPTPPRAGSPNIARSNSVKSTKPPPFSPDSYSPMRSIFPQYDHSKTLDQQQYYPPPNNASLSPAIPPTKISKLEIPAENKPVPRPFDSAVALVDGYEHIPSAGSKDLVAVWNASCGMFPVAGRKVQLGLHQPHGQGTSLAIGRSSDVLLYTMKKNTATPTSDKRSTRLLNVNKHCPEAPSSTSVCQIELPDTPKTDKERQDEVVGIFPQMAAINAIEVVANSPAASAIATFDPEATSPEAAMLAQDAVAESHARYRCDLVRATRRRDSLGAVTATYRLEHPTLGVFAITVSKSVAHRHPRDPRAKISLHHPSATPAAIASETLVLAFLDFARDACVLDVPGLLALEGNYVIDTIISALLTVAVIENDALMAETMTFAPPPKAPIPTPKRKFSSRSLGKRKYDDSLKSRRSWLGRRKKPNLPKNEPQGEQVELPVLTQGALAIIGLSLKTAAWILEAGVKVTAGAVVGVTQLANKA